MSKYKSKGHLINLSFIESTNTTEFKGLLTPIQHEFFENQIELHQSENDFLKIEYYSKVSVNSKRYVEKSFSVPFKYVLNFQLEPTEWEEDL